MSSVSKRALRKQIKFKLSPIIFEIDLPSCHTNSSLSPSFGTSPSCTLFGISHSDLDGAIISRSFVQNIRCFRANCRYSCRYFGRRIILDHPAVNRSRHHWLKSCDDCPECWLKAQLIGPPDYWSRDKNFGPELSLLCCDDQNSASRTLFLLWTSEAAERVMKVSDPVLSTDWGLWVWILER